jgi:hypothetical protein
MPLAIYLALWTVPSEPAIETGLELHDPAFHLVMRINLRIKTKVVSEAVRGRTKRGLTTPRLTRDLVFVQIIIESQS